MSSFQPLLDAIIAKYFEWNPTTATDKGEHKFDSLWPDHSPDGRGRYLKWIEEQLSILRSIHLDGLTFEEKIDYTSILEELEEMRFREVELKEEEWNPLRLVYLLGEGLFSLLSREFAPRLERLRSALERIKGMRKILGEFRVMLGASSTVSRLHTEKAAQRLGGINELIKAVLEEAQREEEEAKSLELKSASSDLLDQLRIASVEATSHLSSFSEWLKTQLLPNASGEYRLSPNLYKLKFKHVLRTDIEPEQLLARARTEFDVVRAEMSRVARPQWNPSLVPSPRRPRFN